MSGNIGFCAQHPEPCICGTRFEDSADIVGVLEWTVPAWRPWVSVEPKQVKCEYHCTHCFLNRANELIELGVSVTITVPPTQEGGHE